MYVACENRRMFRLLFRRHAHWASVILLNRLLRSILTDVDVDGRFRRHKATGGKRIRLFSQANIKSTMNAESPIYRARECFTVQKKRKTYGFSSSHRERIHPHSCQGPLDLRTALSSNVVRAAP